MTVDLDASYRACAEIARRSASSFYWCFRFLPTDKRRAMHALYAFARHTDDLADGDQAPADKQQALTAWRTELTAALAGESGSTLLPALADAVQQHAIPRQYLFDILDGVEMDLKPIEFETFDDLRQYCYRVASAVGLACLHIWGFTGERAVTRAIDRGIAFQLTNILRDLEEDAQRNRLYLPREDLRRFQCTASDLSDHGHPDRVTDLLQFQATRAEEYYRRSKGLVNDVHPDGRRMLRLMTATYWHLLQRVRRQFEHPRPGPVRLGLLSRLRIAHAALFPWGAIRREAF